MLFDLIILLAVLALVAFAAVLLARLYLNRDWRIREVSTGDGLRVEVYKPHQKPIVAGFARRGDSFNADLAWARAEAKSIRDDAQHSKKILDGHYG